MNQTFTINSIFPTPVISSNINRFWTEKEKAFFDYHRNFTRENEGNTVSDNHYILNLPEAKDLLGFISKGIQYYVDNIICPKNPIEFFITQSWLNYTKPGQYHHKHCHPNSIISGVLYIDANREYDKIIFSKNTYQQIEISSYESNIFNAGNWNFKVGSGDLLLFPSHFMHGVEHKKGNNIRCSLAFNVFAKGQMGVEKELTALYLSM